MTPRDQKMALLLIGATALIVGILGGYFFVYDPILKGRAAEAELQGEIAELREKADQQDAKLKMLKVQQVQSLPADQTIAKQEYFVALESLIGRAIHTAEEAGVPRGEIKAAINVKAVDNSARGVPELSKGKPMYTKLAYTVVVRKADMWVVRDVLKAYYELNLLHQITHFNLKKDDENAKGPVKRNDLTLEFTTEAIIVEGMTTGPQYRRTLIAVPSAFAAAGGGGLQQVLERNTEIGRGASARPSLPVLATKPRDYSLIVLKDPFNGPLPPPPPFSLEPVKDVTVKQNDTRAATVKLAAKGEGAAGATYRMIVSNVSGQPLPEGEIKGRGPTFELPKTSAGEGTAKVEVIAKSAEGKEARTTFRVKVEPEPETPIVTPPIKDDVSHAIILTMLTIRHEDGTASAAIRDGANRQRYEIEIEGKKVTVGKFYYIKDKKKEDEVDKSGVLLISDDSSGTKRTFKVIGVDGEGLILEDLKPSGDAPKTEAPRPRGPGGPRGATPPKQGPANPVAAMGGNMASGAGIVASAPKLYRWTVGQSLYTMTKDGPLSERDAQKVLKQAADSGPMLEIAVNQ
ncbi:hypothetical protein GobsT_71920 [Gemmata obscuriglobus]|uniref:Uncharacterized protein n=1 Tax=Gemmata obscuriglobus TaxID=114 RepID=A0A2Z3HIR1_9BACT|nr:hypothetical protein [Gemmata obscuriglobus]AWM41714.1 hypothetical protein C1280_35115 [Gemmata obscuriglobus]QEG32337.1 hypothetical protein GobsT_71920 [Gemmata obscuriglobus]VTS11693.1 unnamed protein product [Gemmata obscuriglobus UQM 2246]